MALECYCGYRHSTDGCKDWSCPYHGKSNRLASIAMRKACPTHTADENGNLVRRTDGQEEGEARAPQR